MEICIALYWISLRFQGKSLSLKIYHASSISNESILRVFFYWEINDYNSVPHLSEKIHTTNEIFPKIKQKSCWIIQ